MSTQKPWQCNCCGHCNSYFSSQCNACFNDNNIPCTEECACVVMNSHLRELVAYGFCRRHSESLKIPEELFQLCLRYYGDSMTWTLKGVPLSDFCSSARERLIVGPQFVLHDVPGQLMLMIKAFDGFRVVFGFMNDPKWFTLNKIESITVHYRLSLDEIEYVYKDTKTLTRNDCKTMWYYPQISLHSLRALKVDKLRFSCYLEILEMVYHTACCAPERIRYFGNLRKMNVDHVFQWNLSDGDMQRLRGCEFNQSIYSPNWNHDSFCLCLSPNGISTARDAGKGVMVTKIKVLRFPRGIGAVEARFTIEMRDADGKVMFGLEGLEMFDYIGRMKDCRLMRKSGMCSVKESKSIQLMVHMTIVRVFDFRMKGIHKSKWLACGLIN